MVNIRFGCNNANGVATWNSGTHGTDGRFLAMQTDGNLVLYSSNWTPIWHTHTNGQNGSHLTLQNDGNLVIYNPATGTAVWNIY